MLNSWTLDVLFIRPMLTCFHCVCLITGPGTCRHSVWLQAATVNWLYLYPLVDVEALQHVKCNNRKSNAGFSSLILSVEAFACDSCAVSECMQFLPSQPIFSLSCKYRYTAIACVVESLGTRLA